MTRKNCPGSTRHCYSRLISSPSSETTTSQQGGIVGKVSSPLWVDMSLPHHVAFPSGVPPAVGYRMPVRRRARTYWAVAVGQGGVAVTSVPHTQHATTYHHPRARLMLLSVARLHPLYPSPQESLQPSLLSPNSVILSRLTSQFNLQKTLRGHKENTGSPPGLHGQCHQQAE